MAYEIEDLTFSLFRNDKKSNDTDADYNGSGKVMDTYKVSGDEAGSVAVAAFDVYCPELS